MISTLLCTVVDMAFFSVPLMRLPLDATTMMSSPVRPGSPWSLQGHAMPTRCPLRHLLPTVGLCGVVRACVSKPQIVRALASTRTQRTMREVRNVPNGFSEERVSEQHRGRAPRAAFPHRWRNMRPRPSQTSRDAMPRRRNKNAASPRGRGGGVAPGVPPRCRCSVDAA